MNTASESPVRVKLEPQLKAELELEMLKKFLKWLWGVAIAIITLLGGVVGYIYLETSKNMISAAGKEARDVITEYRSTLNSDQKRTKELTDSIESRLSNAKLNIEKLHMTLGEYATLVDTRKSEIDVKLDELEKLVLDFRLDSNPNLKGKLLKDAPFPLDHPILTGGNEE